MSAIESPFARFAWPLRKAGFRKTWSSRAVGARVHEWRRDEPDGRELVCDIWSYGTHRLTHEWVGCSDTRPTGFADEAGLARAIAREATRGDSRYGDPFNHRAPGARRYLLDRQGACAAASSGKRAP